MLCDDFRALINFHHLLAPPPYKHNLFLVGMVAKRTDPFAYEIKRRSKSILMSLIILKPCRYFLSRYIWISSSNTFAVCCSSRDSFSTLPAMPTPPLSYNRHQWCPYCWLCRTLIGPSCLSCLSTVIIVIKLTCFLLVSNFNLLTFLVPSKFHLCILLVVFQLCILFVVSIFNLYAFLVTTKLYLHTFACFIAHSPLYFSHQI